MSSEIPTGNPVNPAPVPVQEGLKSTGPPKPTSQPPAPDAQSKSSASSSASSTSPMVPRAPQVSGSGGPDVSHAPNQVRPGLRAPIPVSHTPWEHAASLGELLEECEELWLVARHPRTDALWVRLRAGLMQYRELIWIELSKDSDDPTEELVGQLRQIAFYLGRPAPPRPETEQGA